MKIMLAIAVALAGGWLLLPYIGLSSDQAIEQEKKPRTEFAEDRVGSADGIKPLPFDGGRAMGYLKKVCELGPRMSGTPSMRRQQELIRNHFEKLGAKVQEQTFTSKQSSQPRSVEMANLIVSFQPEKQRRVIFCSHYDTRPIADQEKDPRKWREPFVSANDGGSGVAFLMELGNHLKDLKTNVGVDLVFFDGEEYIFERDRDRYFFGSQHFAQTWQRTKNRPDYAAAILLDMIAGKDARFPLEGYSWGRAPGLCREIWGTAEEQKIGLFKNQLDAHVQDDHLALLNAGIPTIDIIDFSYQHWHRLTDLPENCSAEPMEQVAHVLTVWLQRAK